METAGVGMLVAVAIRLIATGLPAWMILIGVALLFAACGVVAGAFALPLMTGCPRVYWDCWSRISCRRSRSTC